MPLHPETQHYTYTAVAIHLLAVCFYGQNYADELPVFSAYEPYSEPGGYCEAFAIPTADSL